MSETDRSGETSIDIVRADGATHTYRLQMTMAPAIRLQRAQKTTVGKLLTQAIELDFEAIQSLSWILLQEHHGDEFKTQDAVGKLIDEAGGPQVFFKALERLTPAVPVPDAVG